MPVRSTAASGVSQIPSCAWWDIPDSAATIHLYIRVVERLTEEFETNQLAEGPKSEAAGLLLGTIQHDSREHIIITDCVPVHCGGQSASSEELSDADRKVLEALIARNRTGPDRFLYVLGYYRRHQGPGFGLTHRDMAVVQRCLSERARVVLLVQTDPEPVAAVFLASRNGALPECRLLIPFEAAILQSGETEEVEQAREPLTDVAGGFAPEGVPDAAVALDNYAMYPGAGPLENEARPKGILRRMNVVGWILLAAVVAVSAYFGAYVSNQREPWHGGAPTGLSAGMADGVLRIEWDARSPAIAGASRGILSISDGNLRNDLRLTAAQLQAGKIELPQMSSNVSIELLLLADETAAAGIVRTVTASMPVPFEDTRNSMSEPAGRSMDPPAVPETGAGRTAAPPAPAAPKRAPDTDVARVSGPPARPAKIETPQQFERARDEAPPPPAPGSAAVESADKSAVPREMTPPSPEVPPASDPASAVEIRSERPPEATVRTDVLKTPEPADPAAYQPPQPIRRVDPVVPPNYTPEQAQVAVRMYIDANGRVYRTELVSKRNRFSRLALEAALQWQFAPARRGDRNIASETEVEFSFGNKAPY
jgi:hypothetical protein